MAPTQDQTPETKPETSVTLRSSDHHDFSVSEAAPVLSPETKPETSVTLRSSDHQDFSVSEPAAALSITVKTALEESRSDGTVVPLHNVDAKTLVHVVAYLNAHVGMKTKDFDEEFVAGMETEALLDVLMAADYLNIPGLVDLVVPVIAERIKNKSVEWVREAFGVENDYTAEEEEEIRSQYTWCWEGDGDGNGNGDGEADKVN